MCQAGGVRCYNDSSKKLTKITEKLTKANSELAAAQKMLSAAAKGNKPDFNTYAKIRKTTGVLEKKIEVLKTDLRYTQRDVDSTLTGRKLIEEEIKNASSSSELDTLDIRRRTAEGIRYNRSHAFDLKKSGYVPAIRFAKAS
jgi:hypothetical protein